MARTRHVLVAISLMALMLVGFAAPAAAQPVNTAGLVNATIVIGSIDVEIGDVNIIREVDVTIPVAVAANLCDVLDVENATVGILAIIVEDADTGDEETVCEAEAMATA